MPATAQKTGCTGIRGGQTDHVGVCGQRRLIQSLIKDAFNGAVFYVVVVQRPDTGCLQADRAILFLQADNPLGSA